MRRCVGMAAGQEQRVLDPWGVSAVNEGRQKGIAEVLAWA